MIDMRFKFKEVNRVSNVPGVILDSQGLGWRYSEYK